MVNQKVLHGYEEFINYSKTIDPKVDVNILFSGKWCPDCVEAEPNLTKTLTTLPESTIYVYVDVGDRATWKDMKNPFRTDKNTHLSVIPTLIKWKKPQRLEGEQCGNTELLEMFFGDDD